MESKNNIEEILDFNDEVETLNLDNTISTKIDEMLDFFEDSSDKKDNKELKDLLKKSSKERKIEIDASKEKLDDYKPSIKDFNIKSKKTKKIVHKVMLYVIIVMLLGFEFFIVKTGEVLTSFRVYATDNQPIMIEQNEKYGFIDYTGTVIVSPKYPYASDFIKGYSIVKDNSNLPLIIDKGGKEVIPTGNYFSLYRAGNDIIASKVTKKGLKYGVLDENLKIKVKFEYDNISYSNNVYTFSSGNIVGILNEEGKEIFKYKLTDNVEKDITVKLCDITDESFERYASVKINSSYQIVNIENGKIISKATLNEVVPTENNVFYEVMPNGNKLYKYIENDKIILESTSYKSLKINNKNTGVLIALNDKNNYEYISVKTKEQLKKNINDVAVFNGDNVFMYLDYDYKNNKQIVNLVKKGELYKSIPLNFKIINEFENGFCIVKFDDNTYNYMNEDGQLLNDMHFVDVKPFDAYGDAIAKTTDGYGVINKEGKIIIPFENKEVKMGDIDYKKKANANNKNVFYAVKKDNRYALYNNKGKKYNDIYYSNVTFDLIYPIIKTETEYDDLLIIPENGAKIKLTSSNAEYKAYENYIILKNEYYNYKGKLIYVDNSKEN